MASQWNFRLFKHTELSQLEAWVNGLNANWGDVEAAVAGNDFHVWARQGNRRGGHWESAHERWGSNSAQNTETALNQGDRILLGLSQNDFHYLQWNQT